MEKKKTRLGYLMLLPSILLIMVLILYPTIKTIVDSFFDIRVQTAAMGSKFVGLKNYMKAFSDQHFWETLQWTLIFTVVSVGMELIIGMALALLMKKKIPGQGLIRTVVLVPWAIPTIVSGIVWTQFFSQNGLINYVGSIFGFLDKNLTWFGSETTAKIAVLIADIWKATPYMSLLLLAGLVTIAPEYYEAAELDGAGPIRRFFSITIPLIKPTMMVTILFRIISATRVYDLIVAMTNGGPAGRTETLSMYAVNTYFNYGNIGYGAAMSVIMLLVSVGISMFFIDSLKARVE